ncbi:MAG: type II toxin-antitoxin system HicB family antitoxin [bacterium]
MPDYLIILERGESNWGAYSPDVPGCIAVGDSRDKALALFMEALEAHLAAMLEEGIELPHTTNYALRTTEVERR